MFISTFENKLDKKGRVSVPATFRSHLSSLVITVWFATHLLQISSIEFCAQSRIEKIMETIDNLNPFEENRDIFSTSILANSHQLNFDTEGRVTLTEKLIKHTGVKEKVLFVGQGKTFQMWEPSQFKKFSDEARKKAKSQRSSLKWNQNN